MFPGFEMTHFREKETTKYYDYFCALKIHPKCFLLPVCRKVRYNRKLDSKTVIYNDKPYFFGKKIVLSVMWIFHGGLYLL